MKRFVVLAINKSVLRRFGLKGLKNLTRIFINFFLNHYRYKCVLVIYTYFGTMTISLNKMYSFVAKVVLKLWNISSKILKFAAERWDTLSFNLTMCFKAIKSCCWRRFCGQLIFMQFCRWLLCTFRTKLQSQQLKQCYYNSASKALLPRH